MTSRVRRINLNVNVLKGDLLLIHLTYANTSRSQVCVRKIENSPENNQSFDLVKNYHTGYQGNNFSQSSVFHINVCASFLIFLLLSMLFM